MKIQSFRLFGLVLITGLLFALTFSASYAQENQPPEPPPPGVLPRDAHGLGYLQKGPIQPAMRLMAPSAPDDFGYTWDSDVPHAYVGASGGTTTGISSSNTVSGAIPIGFTFPFYENSYSQIFVSRHGFASFAAQNLLDDQSGLPASAPPNNVIAPHWAPFYYMSPGSYVNHQTVGEEPNRSFVVEWYRMSPYAGASEDYTFSMVLHENGDIDFHYASMSQPADYYCQSSGIEDSTGQDGLLITPYCTLIAANHTVQITRPVDSAHLAIDPLYQGAFTQPGAQADFEITLTNSGELGPDTYNFSISPPSSWPVTLYASDQTTPLVDSASDADTTPDSGEILPGSSITVFARVAVPSGAVVGDHNNARVTFCSAQDTAKCKTVTLQLAIPAPFAQVINDGGMVSQAFVQPSGLQVVGIDEGDNPAVLQLPNGTFINAWSANRCLTAGCVLSADELWFTLFSNSGSTLLAPTRLADLSGSTTNVSDGSLVMAGAPDGSIGLLWVRQRVNASLLSNYNLFFAILDSRGQLSYGPENLTNNNDFGTLSTPNVPMFSEAAISATGNNRFVLAWGRTHRAASCSVRDCLLDNLYYSVRSSSGAVQHAVTQFTSDQPSATYDGHNYPNLTPLSGDRALLTWSRGSDLRVYYAVLDSAGNVVKNQTLIPEDDVNFNNASFDPDAAQLSNGNIIVAWYGSRVTGNVIRYAILNPNYAQQEPAQSLPVPTDFSGATYVSVTADDAGRAILTWMDYSWDYRSSLSYALVDSSGEVLTQPMVFYTSQAEPPYVKSNLSGFGNTTYRVFEPLFLPLIRR